MGCKTQSFTFGEVERFYRGSVFSVLSSAIRLEISCCFSLSLSLFLCVSQKFSYSFEGVSFEFEEACVYILMMRCICRDLLSCRLMDVKIMRRSAERSRDERIISLRPVTSSRLKTAGLLNSLVIKFFFKH